MRKIIGIIILILTVITLTSTIKIYTTIYAIDTPDTLDVNNNIDVFDKYNFKEEKSILKKGIGDSGFNKLKNDIKDVSVGNNAQYGKYIEFTYGSIGANGGNNRYVNFQMELSKEFRNNESLVNGSDSYVSHSLNKQNIVDQLPGLGQKNTQYGNRKVYKTIFDMRNKNYHSGTVTARVYLKNKSDRFQPSDNTPLFYMYYKSGDYDNNNEPDSGNYYIYETTQLLNYGELIDAAINKVNQTSTNMISRINNSNLNKTDKNNLIQQVNSANSDGIQRIKNIPNENHKNNLFTLIDKQENIINSINSVNLLKFSKTSEIIFNDASTNNGSSNVSKQSIDKSNLAISSFNNQSWSINLLLSNLQYNNKNLQNLNFYFNGKNILPNNEFNYINNNNSKDGTNNYSVPNIGLNYDKGVMPSGTYHGTATWKLSTQLGSNGINIKN